MAVSTNDIQHNNTQYDNQHKDTQHDCKKWYSA
jgi:hypothetical protein